MKTIRDKMSALPPEAQQEVEDFIEFLLEKRELKKQSATSNRNPQFGWASALSNLGERHTSVELQHEISQRRVLNR